VNVTEKIITDRRLLFYAGTALLEMNITLVKWEFIIDLRNMFVISTKFKDVYKVVKLNLGIIQYYILQGHQNYVRIPLHWSYCI